MTFIQIVPVLSNLNRSHEGIKVQYLFKQFALLAYFVEKIQD